ncbi:unnamed protein product, partial [Heterotrigona itama]
FLQNLKGVQVAASSTDKESTNMQQRQRYRLISAPHDANHYSRVHKLIKFSFTKQTN